MGKLTHLDGEGNAVMVDVSDKDITERTATARGSVFMKPETMALIVSDGVKKGDVLSVAQLAGIMAAKKTPELIPLCHPLSLSSVSVDLVCDLDRNAVDITASCKLAGKTGVEMEALTGASVAALTLYDMCKSVSKAMVIESIKLIEKTGGKSGDYHADAG